MRGTIPKERLDKIHSGLPASMQLHEGFTAVGGFLIGSDSKSHDAQLQFWMAWGLLNETHLALTEAEACKVWYQEFRQPPDNVAATYFSRFFLDDAALRLYASREHFLKGIVDFWNLAHPSKKVGTLLDWVLTKLREKKIQPQIVEWLEKIQSNADWEKCAKYRNGWVHNERGDLVGLSPANRITFTYTKDPHAEVVTVGMEHRGQMTIDDLARTMRGAYKVLFRFYEKSLDALAPEAQQRLHGGLLSPE